jgi:hypothetical protein
LANVAGFDGSVPIDPNDADMIVDGGTTPLNSYGTGQGGDFFKAVSLLALLDTHFLTTRSNTFTVYLTLADRQDPQASVRSQMTVDRSNLLPRLMWQDVNGNGIQDPPDPNNPSNPNADHYAILGGDAEPEVIGRRQVSYFNSRYDE